MLSKLHVASRGDPESDGAGKSFSGVLYRVRVMASKDIKIDGLSFFGLHQSFPHEKFPVLLALQIEDIKRRTLYPLQFFKKECMKSEELMHKFGNPIKIPKNTCIEIGFELGRFAGNTCGCTPVFEHLPADKCKYFDLFEKEGMVTFEFGSSSSQLSKIFYEVDEHSNDGNHQDTEASKETNCVDSIACRIA